MAKNKPIADYYIGVGKRPWGGLNTATKDNRDMEIGECYDELNWITGRDKDNIQLRRGQALLGTTRRNVVNQHVSGIGVGTLENNTQQLFYTFGQKIMFYNNTTADTQEVNTPNILPVAANDEDMCIQSYSNIAGSFVYLSSPNSNIYKIPVADPADVINMNSIDFHFGYFKFDQSRMVAVNRQGISQNSVDKTGLYLSAVDTNTPSNTFISLVNSPTLVNAGAGATGPGTFYYVVTVIGPGGVESVAGTQSSIILAGGSTVTISFPAVSGAKSYKLYRSTISGVFVTPAFIASSTVPLFSDSSASPLTGAPPVTSTQGTINQIGIGDGITKTFSGVFSAGTGTALSIYGVTITDNNETFQDDKSGNLVGSLGGTGTINYATGAYSVTFNTAPAIGARITGSFFQEDSFIGGVVDFAIDGTNNAKAQVFRQDDGGGIAQAVSTYQGIEYCFHVLRSWQFSMQTSGSNITFSNLPYYEQIGIPYSRSQFQTGDGIIFIDNSNPANPTFSILQIPPGSTNLTVVPKKLSDKLDLSSFGFSRCVIRRFGDYDLMGIETTNQFGQFVGYNTQCFIRNIWSGLWNKLDYEFSCLEQFIGTLVSGDTLSPNVFTLFSGFDDDGQIIDNFWNHAFLNLELEGLKTVGYLHVEGLIQKSQSIQMSIALDGGNYVPVAFGPILGTGSYVNQGSAIGVGTFTLGSNIVGGPGSAQIYGNKFELDIPIHTDRFEFISFQAQALGIGWAQINKIAFKDIRIKRKRLSMYTDSEINN